MMEFLKILGLTILGLIALLIGGFLICWLMLWIWPIVIIALPIAGLIYLIELIRFTKPKKKNKK